MLIKLQAGLKASHGSAEYIRAIESRRSIKVSWKLGLGIGVRSYPLNPNPLSWHLSKIWHACSAICSLSASKQTCRVCFATSSMLL